MAKIDFRLNTGRGYLGKQRTLRAIRVRISLGYSTTIGGKDYIQVYRIRHGAKH